MGFVGWYADVPVAEDVLFSPTNVTAFSCLLGITMIYWIASVCGLLYFRDDPLIESREFSLIFTGSMGGFCLATVMLVGMIRPIECETLLFLCIIGESVQIVSIMGRSLHLIFQVQIQEACVIHQKFISASSVKSDSSSIEQVNRVKHIAYTLSIWLPVLLFIVLLVSIGLQSFLNCVLAHYASDTYYCDRRFMFKMGAHLLLNLLFSLLAAPLGIWKMHTLKINHPIRNELYWHAFMVFGFTLMYYLWCFPLQGIVGTQSYVQGNIWVVLSCHIIQFQSVTLPVIQAFIRTRKLHSKEVAITYTMPCLMTLLDRPRSREKLEAIAMSLYCIEMFLFLRHYRKVEIVSMELYRRSVTALSRRPSTHSAAGAPSNPASGSSKFRISTSNVNRNMLAATDPKSILGSLASLAGSILSSRFGRSSKSGDSSDEDAIIISDSRAPRDWVVPEELHPAYRRILRLYLKDGAPKELNLSAETRQNVLHELGFLDIPETTVVRSPSKNILATTTSFDRKGTIHVGCLDGVHQEVVKMIYENVFPIYLEQEGYKPTVEDIP